MQAASIERQQKFSMIERWRTSGLTQKAFCEQQSVRYYIFHYWYKRYREQHGASQKDASSFVKLQIAKPPASSGSVEVYYPGGMRIIFHEPVSSSYLKALVS